MKSDLVTKAVQEAREACEGLGLTEQQIQEFIQMHIEGELRRDEEKAKELASAKRNKALTDALIHIAVSPWRRRYDPHNPDETFPNEPHGTSTGHSAEDQRDADTYQNQRNRGET